VDDAIAEYLATGALPRRLKANRSDKRCKAITAPDPTVAAAKPTERAAVRTRLDLQRLIGVPRARG